jgi:hypothetical protein
MSKGLNEESERMMLLLQELAVLERTGSKKFNRLKRRKEITQEMKRLAAEKKKTSSSFGSKL